MLKSIGRALALSFGMRPPGRAVEVEPDDVFVVSYPKSGNTWVRFMIAALVAPARKIDFVNIREMVPNIYRTPARVLARIDRPRILKSHEYFDARYPRVIYLVRDPRDVCVSYFHYLRRVRAYEGSLDEHVARFLAGELDDFGRWSENVGSWLGARRERDDLLLVRYEDLLAAPARELGRIAQFLGLPGADDAIEQAVQRSSFEEMQRLERFQAEVTGEISPDRVRQPFVRAGRGGSWLNELPPHLAAAIERECRWPMAMLGYRPSAGARSDAAKAG